MLGKRRSYMKIARGEIRRGDEWRSNDPRDKGLLLTVVSMMRVEETVRRRQRLLPSSIITLKDIETNRVTQVRLDEITKRFTKVRSGPPRQRDTIPVP